jgi:two-component system sensor histidine kinase NreB
LHDGPVQALASINFSIQAMLSDYPGNKLAKDLKGLQEKIREQIQVLRGYSVELRPPILAHLGLDKAIQSHAETFRENYPELTLRLETQKDRTILSENVGVALFRIYQEALLNIVKHAVPTATEVIVQLEKDEHLIRLEVQDNGGGFDIPDQWLDFAQDGHLGLLGMRERAEAVGGQFKIQSSKGSGTHIQVTVPLDHSPARQSA